MNCPKPSKPLLNGIRITAQITAGLLIGLPSAAIASKMAACAPHGRYYFPAEFFTYVGYLLTCPLGVYMAGRIAKQRGPFWPTFAGAHLAFEAMLAEMVVLSAIIYLGPLARETFTIIPFVAAPLIGALIGFNTNYTKPITGCTLTALRKPPLRLGRIAAQIVVGPIVGAIGAIGFFVAARSAQAHTIIDFMQVGYLVACPCCIYLVGRSRGQTASFWATLGGAHLAFEVTTVAIVGFSIIADLDPLEAEKLLTMRFYPALGVPVLGALLGFNLTRRERLRSCKPTADSPNRPV